MRLERQAGESLHRPLIHAMDLSQILRTKGLDLSRDVTSLIFVLLKYLPGRRDSIKKHLCS